MKLYVGNISFDTNEQELEDAFSELGTVNSVNIIYDRDSGRSRGFGFVEMSSVEEGSAAIEQMNGKDLAGRNIVVNEARQREERSRGAGGGSW